MSGVQFGVKPAEETEVYRLMVPENPDFGVTVIGTVAVEPTCEAATSTGADGTDKSKSPCVDGLPKLNAV